MLTGKELSFFKFGIPLFDCSLVSKRHPLLNNCKQICTSYKKQFQL